MPRNTQILGLNCAPYDLYDSVKLDVWENTVFELNAKMLLANQIAGSFNFDISKTIWVIWLIFCMYVHIY